MKPILFNTEMVRAILDGRKTCTRRVIKFPEGQTGRLPENGDRNYIFYPSGIKYAPYKAGDILYVRETWQFIPCIDCGAYLDNMCSFKPVVYEDKYSVSEGCFIYREDCVDEKRVVWHPSIHMPKEAARLFLRVKDVRVERLCDMKIEDYIREGIERRELSRKGCSCEWEIEGCKEEPCGNRDAYEYDCWADPFVELWDSTIKKSELNRYGFAKNPWVWVIEFERCEKPEVEET